ALARGLREGGVEGFVAAYGEPPVPEQWRDTVLRVTRQRLSAHAHPEAVADALEAVPRSRPFERWADLSGVDAPAVVVASRRAAASGGSAARTIPVSPSAAAWPVSSAAARSASASELRSGRRQLVTRSNGDGP